MKIVDIKKITNKSKRYDIQTKTQNFFANKILVHNSIITVWYDVYQWHISTNGTINAFEAPLQFASGYLRTFGDLFMEALRNSAPKEVINDICNNTTQVLKPENTYIFELTSLLNKVVVSYPENKIFHIGTRNNNTLKEFEVDIGVTKPKLYKFSSFEEMLEVVRNFPKDQEGIVLVDANYNRVKIKGTQYLVAHKLKSNGIITKNKIWEIVCQNEQSEFLSYFPEYKPMFDPAVEVYNFTKIKLTELKNIVLDKKNSFNSKKDFAAWVFSNFDIVFSTYLFCVWDGKDNIIPLIDFVEKIGEKIWINDIQKKVL